MEKNRRRDRRIIALAVLVLLLAAGSFRYLRRGMKKSPDNRDNIVTATGVTETGLEPVIFTVDYLKDTGLCVEDVYIQDGDTVAAGEPYLKLTDESIGKARAELEREVQDAALAYRSRIISNGEDKIQAKYTYDTTMLEAKFAPQVYQDTLTQLQLELTKAIKDFEDAQNAYNAYNLAVAGSTFYEDYQVEALKKAYDDAYDLFASRRAYWGVTQEELDQLDDSGGRQNGQDDRQWIVRTVALLKDELTEAQNQYEQAKHDYQREIEGAGLKLRKLLNQSKQAEQNLLDAQIAYQQGSLHARTIYELAVAKGQLAESEYNVCLRDIADELEHLKAAMEEAAENMAVFDELAGDGYLYAKQAGTVSMVQASRGQVLEDGSLVFAYAGEGALSVSVTVPGADAAKLFVGERASVTVADCGSFDGVVTAVQPITAVDVPGNINSSYRIVSVSLDGDAGMIPPEQTAAVVFMGNLPDDAVLCSAGGHSKTESHMYDVTMPSDAADCLEAARVYVETGQHVSERDPVCQFTQESINRVRKAFTDMQSEAGKALARAQAAYHTGVLEAGLSHNEAMVGRTLAQMTYDNTIAKLNTRMTAKILETEQLMADIYELQTTLTDDAHQRQQAEITKAYERAREQMENARESFVTGQVEAAENLQAARDAYEQFFAQLEASGQEIAGKAEQVCALQEEILQSQQSMEKELLAAEQARTRAQSEGETAYARYTSILKAYESAVDKAQSDLEQATRALDGFNRFVGDGTVYAAGNGLVTAVGCKEGGRVADLQKLVLFLPDTDTAADTPSETDGREEAP